MSSRLQSCPSGEAAGLASLRKRVIKFNMKIFGLALLMVSLSSAQDRSAEESVPQGDIARGLDVFEAQCFDCHNADSDVVKTGPGFKGVKNGKLPSGKDATRENILDITNAGVEDQMPAYADILSKQEKEDVIAYVLSR